MMCRIRYELLRNKCAANLLNLKKKRLVVRVRTEAKSSKSVHEGEPILKISPRPSVVRLNTCASLIRNLQHAIGLAEARRSSAWSSKVRNSGAAVSRAVLAFRTTCEPDGPVPAVGRLPPGSSGLQPGALQPCAWSGVVRKNSVRDRIAIR